MSEQELNSYRLTSLEEPTDEMLEQIMKEIAEEVREKNNAIERQFMENIRLEVRRRRELKEAL